MGCAASNMDMDAVDRSKGIDDVLYKDKKALSKVIKLLLLGTGESGKSTIAKQMKIIHLNGFTDEERKAYTMAVHTNVYLSTRALINAAKLLGIKTKVTQDMEEKFAPMALQGLLTPDLGKVIDTVWKDSGIQDTYDRRNEFQLIDSAQYYLDAISRIAADGYVPNDQDVLRSRVQTTGVIETEFELKGYKFLLVDVGGQRSERKKWIHCFEDVTAVLFCVAISEFDQVLYEDSTINRMAESLKLFHEICSSKWFGQTGMILFLNKCDLFQEKIESGKSITTAFPDYKGPSTYNDCTEFIKMKFLDVEDPITGKPKDIFPHLTCATDTNNVRKVFDSVESFITNQNLDAVGLT